MLPALHASADTGIRPTTMRPLNRRRPSTRVALVANQVTTSSSGYETVRTTRSFWPYEKPFTGFKNDRRNDNTQANRNPNLSSIDPWRQTTAFVNASFLHPARISKSRDPRISFASASISTAQLSMRRQSHDTPEQV